MRIPSLLMLLATPPAMAEGTRERFVTAFRCQVEWRLTKIHERGPQATSRDRFLVVALRRDPQSYVQCLSVDEDATMLCEASSGAYRYAPSDGMRLAQSEASVTALQALGFAQPDPESNFRQEIALGTPPRLGAVATLMLRTLHDAYGADPLDTIEMDAPKASDPDTGCGPPFPRKAPAAGRGGARQPPTSR